MNPSSSSTFNNAGKQPKHSSESAQYNPDISLALYPLYDQAEAAKAKIERTVSQLPQLAAQAEEYLTQEMANVTDSYFEGIASEDPMDAQKQIEEAIARMDAFYNDLGNRMQANTSSRSRAFTEPGPRPQLTSLSADIPGQTGESSATGSHRQQPLRPLGIFREELENDATEYGLMHPGERVIIMPPPPTRRVTFGEIAVIPDSATGPGLRRPLTFRSVVGALKRNPGESKREKVKDLWRKIRDRVRKDHSA